MDDGGTGAAQQAPNNDDENIPDMDDDDIPDMDDEMERMDAQAAANSDNIFEQEEFKGPAPAEPNAAVKSVRMYDLSITYDYYHRTPRLWLQGYSEEGQLLTQQEMF